MKMREPVKTQTQLIMEHVFQIKKPSQKSATFKTVSIAKDLNLPQPTLRRCLQVMVKLGFVTRTNKAGKYYTPTEEQLSDYLKWKFVKGRKQFKEKVKVVA